MTQVSVSRAFSIERRSWLVQLRAACHVLTERSATVATAMSVDVRVADLTPGERQQLSQLAVNLAGEFGLSAEVSETNTWMTARLARTASHGARDESPKDEEPTRPGVLARFFARIFAKDKVGAERESQKVSTGDASEVVEEGALQS